VTVSSGDEFDDPVNYCGTFGQNHKGML